MTFRLALTFYLIITAGMYLGATAPLFSFLAGVAGLVAAVALIGERNAR